MNKPDKDVVIDIRWNGESGGLCTFTHNFLPDPDFLQLLNLKAMLEDTLAQIDADIDALRLEKNK